MKYSALLGAALLLALSVGCTPKYTQPELGARKVNILTEGKFQFKDLNKNGRISEERLNQAASRILQWHFIFGRYNPKSKLPFEIPSSMEAVRAQKEDLPFDSVNPSFPFGFGLSY